MAGLFFILGLRIYLRNIREKYLRVFRGENHPESITIDNNPIHVL
jgi:hypothetical protein